MGYSELFSSFGYRALDIILNIDTSTLHEADLKKLALLVNKLDNNELMHELISEIAESADVNCNKVRRLLALTDSCRDT